MEIYIKNFTSNKKFKNFLYEIKKTASIQLTVFIA